MDNRILDSIGNELVVDKFYIINKKNLQYKGEGENGILRFQKNSRGNIVSIDPNGTKFTFSYKQEFEPTFAFDPNYDSDLVEYDSGDAEDVDEYVGKYGGGRKRRRTRRNKARKSRKIKSRKNRKSRKHRKHRKSRKIKSRRQ